MGVCGRKRRKRSVGNRFGWIGGGEMDRVLGKVVRCCGLRGKCSCRQDKPPRFFWGVQCRKTVKITGNYIPRFTYPTYSHRGKREEREWRVRFCGEGKKGCRHVIIVRASARETEWMKRGGGRGGGEGHVGSGSVGGRGKGIENENGWI